ncbi:FAD binding domain-containing protein [Panaeolus papilionaceus]|nr:FAD binding domain-containing protein [Panaeolus papilionaceus]
MTINQGPVLISGAGPTGLVLAIMLRKNGIPVRIIDKLPTPQRGERGSGISPRTIELHHILGTAPKILQAAIPVPLCRFYDPEDGITPLKTFDLMPNKEPTAHTPLGNYVMLGQNHHERILRDTLEELGTIVEHGTELQTFSQTESGVQATLTHHSHDKTSLETIETPWLVGTDGAHSIVRKTLGLQFLGETKVEQRMLFCDIKVKGPRREFIESWGDRSKGFVFSRPSGQDDVLWILFSGSDLDVDNIHNSREKILETFYSISKRRDIEFGDLLSSAIWTPNIRMVQKMRVERVIVLGDAAHCHSPAGGQGLNASIQDAINLGWKLSLVYHGKASSRLLETFDEERLPVIAAMLNKTTELMEQTIKSEQGIYTPRGTDLFQLGVNYRDSSIVLGAQPPEGLKRWPAYNQESETAALPGDRAPDAPSLLNAREGKTTRLFDVLSPSQHTILCFGTEGNSLAVLVDELKKLPRGTIQVARILAQSDQLASCRGSDHNFDIVLQDKGGYVASGYHVDDPSHPLAIVIRPDGIVGARVTDKDGLAQYFGLVFA